MSKIRGIFDSRSVETTGFYGSSHAVETMDSDSEAPALLNEDIPG